MGNFLYGWRRKAGVVMAALALVLVFWWARSQWVADVFFFRNELVNSYAMEFTDLFDTDYSHVVASDRSNLLWMRRREKHDRPVYAAYPADGDILDRLIPQADVSRQTIIQIPYAALVVPLMLLSVRLILWPSRRKPKPQTNQPAALP